MARIRQIVWKLKPVEKSLYAVLSIGVELAQRISALHSQVGDGANAWVSLEAHLQVCQSPARYEHVKDALTGRGFTEAMANGARFFCGERIELDEEDRYPVADYALVVSEATFWFQIWGQKHFQDYYETPEIECGHLIGLLEEGRFEGEVEDGEDADGWAVAAWPTGGE